LSATYTCESPWSTSTSPSKAGRAGRDAVDDRLLRAAGLGPGVGLHRKHHPEEPGVLGGVEGGVDPVQRGGHPCVDLCGLLSRRGRVAQAGVGGEPVVAPDHVQRGEGDARLDPAHVLDERWLVRQPHATPAEGRPGIPEERRAQGGEALERLVAAVDGPVAVGPLVVTGV
jgi:hypothetical protein